MTILPPRRAGRAAPEALVATRAAIVDTAMAVAIDPRVMASERKIGGVRTIVLTSPAPRARLIHFHGGGYRCSLPERVAGFLSALAAETEIEMFAPAYGLGPEQPFPAAVHDGHAVLAALAQENDNRPLFLAGDSAGGGLALVLATSRPADVALAGIVMLSPWTDLTLKADSYARNVETDPMFSPAAAAECVDLYLQGADPGDPLASPLFAALDRMPPSLIVAGAEELIVDDSLAVAHALAIAGREVSLHVVPGMLHGAAVLDPSLHGAAQATAEVEAFLTRRVEASAK